MAILSSLNPFFSHVLSEYHVSCSVLSPYSFRPLIYAMHQFILWFCDDPSSTIIFLPERLEISFDNHVLAYRDRGYWFGKQNGERARHALNHGLIIFLKRDFITPRFISISWCANQTRRDIPRNSESRCAFSTVQTPCKDPSDPQPPLHPSASARWRQAEHVMPGKQHTPASGPSELDDFVSTDLPLLPCQ